MNTMQTKTGHIVGATYFSTYWKQTYQVICKADTEIVMCHHEDGVKVLWEDGRITTHCTPVGDDPMVKEPQYMEL